MEFNGYFFNLVLAYCRGVDGAFAAYLQAKGTKIAEANNFTIGQGLWYYLEKCFDNGHGVGRADGADS